MREVTPMTEKNLLSRPKQCYFCHPDEGFGYMRRVYKYDVKTLGTWGNFSVLPMVGAGIEGYLLVVHKDHYHSLAEIPIKDIKSLRSLINIIKKVMAKSYGSYIVFEHGSTCDNISCLIDHAHLHITPVPNGFDILEDIEKDYKMTPIRSYTDLTYWRKGRLGRLQYQIIDREIDESTVRKKFQSFVGYLYYERTSGEMFIHELEDIYTFQPQYLRMLILKKLGKEKWEWNKNINSECQRRTIENLKDLKDYLTDGYHR